MTKEEIIATQLKALAIFDANNTVMDVKECAEFLGVCERTVTNRIKSKNKHNEIHATYVGGWRIPKFQFLESVVKSWGYDEEPKKIKKVSKPIRKFKTYLMIDESNGFIK